MNFKDGLVEHGILKISDDGQFVHVEDPAERQFIQQENSSKKKVQAQVQPVPEADNLDVQSHRSFQSAHDDQGNSKMEGDLSDAD